MTKQLELMIERTVYDFVTATDSLVAYSYDPETIALLSRQLPQIQEACIKMRQALKRIIYETV